MWIPSTKRGAVQLIVALAFLIRLPVWLFGHQIEWPDAIGYMRLADRLRHWDLVGYDGQRTPGYPLLILAAGQQPSMIWLVQLALGAAISVIIFYATHTLTRSTKWSLMAAVGYLVGPHFIVYESSILSETWCTFLTVLPVYLYLRIVGDARRPALLTCVAMGGVVGLGVLTRPLQAILIPLFGLALIPRPWLSRDFRHYRRALACVTPAILITLCWCGFNRATLGTFTLSTMSGIAMLNVTTGFIERSGPQYQTLVNAILPHRAELIRKTGSGANVGWLAYRDMRQATGLTDAELSRELLRMSAAAVIASPGAWARVVTRGWIKFWFCPGGLVRDVSGSTVLGVVTAAPFVLANLCFVCVACLAVVSGRLRRRFTASHGLWLIVAMAAAASVAQAVLEGTSGTRYAIPYQPLFFIVLAVVGSWVGSTRPLDERCDAQWI